MVVKVRLFRIYSTNIVGSEKCRIYKILWSWSQMFFTYFLKVHLVTLGNILDMGSIRSIGSSSISCTTCIPYVLNSPSKTTTIFLLFYFYTELLFICVFYRTDFYLKHFFSWLKNFMVNWQSVTKNLLDIISSVFRNF